MAKITITADGIAEVFDFDGTKKPMSEALLIEKDLGCRHGEYEADLEAGSARALCEFVRVVWLRNGRDVPLADLLDGKPEIDLNGFSFKKDGQEPVPTSLGSSPGTAPEALSSTSAATSRRSSASASNRGKSKS